VVFKDLKAADPNVGDPMYGKSRPALRAREKS